MTQPLAHLAETLDHVEHFKRFSASDRLVIVKAGQIRTFPADSIIYHESEPCAGMFVLFSGHVHPLARFKIARRGIFRTEIFSNCSNAIQRLGWV